MTRRFIFCWFLVMFALAWSQDSDVYAGIIANGDFSVSATDPLDPSPFEGWSTDTDSGFVAPVDGSGFAMFSVTGFFDPFVHLEQTFSLPGGATTLSFELLFSSESGGTTSLFGFDSFQVSLFDNLGNSYFSSLPGILDAFYALDASGFEDTGTGVFVEDFPDRSKRVTLDVSSLGENEYTIDFLLLGEDDGFKTTVVLDNVVVAQGSHVIPEPATITIWAVLGGVVALWSKRRKRICVAA